MIITIWRIKYEKYHYDLHLSHHDTDNEYSAFKSTLDRLIKLKADLIKNYPDCKEILEGFQIEDGGLNNFFNRSEFRKGFRIGVQLVLEMIKPILMSMTEL